MNAYTNGLPRRLPRQPSSSAGATARASDVIEHIDGEDGGDGGARKKRPTIPNPRVTALISGIVLCVVLAMMFSLQRTTYLDVCKEMTNRGSTSVCFGNAASEMLAAAFPDPLAAELADTELLSLKEMPAIAHARDVLRDNKPSELDAVYFGFLGMIASAALVLIVIAGLPGEQVQFAGIFGKEGAKVKVAGAIGLVAVFAAVSFLYSWTALPNSVKVEASQDTIDSLMEENAYLRSAITERVKLFDRARDAYDKSIDTTYASLVEHIGDASGNFARSILENGYFANLRGQFSVRCHRASNRDDAFGQPDQLMIHVPQAGGNNRTLEAGSFKLSFKPLKDALDAQAQGEAPSREPDMEVQLKDKNNDALLAELGYSITKPFLAARPNERNVVMQGYIDRLAIDRFCDGQGSAEEAIVSIALPDAPSQAGRF